MMKKYLFILLVFSFFGYQNVTAQNARAFEERVSLGTTVGLNLLGNNDALNAFLNDNGFSSVPIASLNWNIFQIEIQEGRFIGKVSYHSSYSENTNEKDRISITSFNTGGESIFMGYVLHSSKALSFYPLVGYDRTVSQLELSKFNTVSQFTDLIQMPASCSLRQRYNSIGLELNGNFKYNAYISFLITVGYMHCFPAGKWEYQDNLLEDIPDANPNSLYLNLSLQLDLRNIFRIEHNR